MKKIFTAIAALALVCTQAQAQGFLSKLKEKAGQAVGSRIGNALGIGASAGTADEQVLAAYNDDGDAPRAVTGEQALPAKRASTFGWDGPVTPSSAKFPIPLMKEFPAVPPASELAHPTEASQIAYYRAIKAVTLRAEELNEDTTCEDGQTLMYREKANTMLSDLFGFTPAEIDMLQDENLPEADKKRLEEKMQKAVLGDTDTDALEAKAARLENMSEDQLMAAYQRGELNDLTKMAGSARSISGKVAPIMEMEQKMGAYFANVQKLLQIEDKAVDARFASADRKKLLSLKQKIYSTDDPSVYNPLYLEALQLIRTYRERAAKVWAADVQDRFDKMKANLSELIKLNRQAVADELIPECALWRLPLNVVISSGDILAEAYSEFPCDYPPMYNEEVVRELDLSKVPGGGRAWFPEFSVFGASHFDEIAAGKYVFASNENGEVYQFGGGTWTRLSDARIRELSEMKKGAAAAKGQTWTSRDGMRTVTFNGEGGYIVLPEGDEIFQAHAWKAFPDKIQWIYAGTSEDGKYQLVLCTYKL